VTSYVALLRGVNVGGRKLAMADLRRVFVDLGYPDAQTYLQSGNAVFEGPPEEPARLAGEIAGRIAQDFGVATTVLLRTGDDLARVVADNPFLKRGDDPATLHVTFLAEAPRPGAEDRLALPGAEPDEFTLVGREVYLRCPNGYGRTRLNNAFIERRLGVAATTRNWRTVTALRDLAGR
jgi:uncharacterized protein (DUF1697 family)